MELFQELRDYNNLRRLLELASDRTYSCWRFFFGTTLSNLIYRVKREQASEFAQLLANVPGVLVSLDLGHHSFFQEKIVRNLTFSSPGRTVASIAFISYILDKWSSSSRLSWGYTLDYMAISLWRVLVRRRRVCSYLPARPLPDLDRVVEEEQQQEEEEDNENPRAGLDPPREV